jgi:hypothetical protein
MYNPLNVLLLFASFTRFEIPSLVLRSTMGIVYGIKKGNNGPKPIILLLKFGGSHFLDKMLLKYKDMFLITEKKNLIIITASE